VRASVVAVSLVIVLSCVGVPNARTTDVKSLQPGGTPPSFVGPVLAFGLRNDPDDLGWMRDSGVPWLARYTYLAGGVNTNRGWSTWSEPDKPGEYVARYLRASQDAGYLPIVTYYQLLHSTPSNGYADADRLVGALKNPPTMRYYFADFELLMRTVARVGGNAIIHVEPDLWGYLQRNARGGDAHVVQAAVASSGYPGIGDLADTAVGFARALIRIRDHHAPQVLLAIHASTWGSGADPVTDQSDGLDVGPLAADTARFIRSIGVGSGGFDVVFTDIVDRDAAFDVSGQAGIWWDTNDVRYPNFARWLRFVRALSAGLGQRLVVWQVPLGNQRYRTLNNTYGHYQDNRAEYFFTHTADLAAAGIVLVLFGAGVDGATTNVDTRGDGVTNPGPIAAPGCKSCNQEIAVVADDDGGFLRSAAREYYALSGTPLPP